MNRGECGTFGAVIARFMKYPGPVMEFDEDQQATAIAAEWGVDVALLEQASWTLETIDGADGELYGHMVRFDYDGTPPEILAQLGLRPGERTRQLSINAFDTPDVGPDDYPRSRRRETRGADKRAYHIDDQRFTPSQFKKLSKARKIEAMKQWFLERFEDPANSTSYMTSEGGYLWNNGGPYDADDELQNEFQGLASFDIIQEAVEEVQSDGIYEWAPIRSDYDYDDNDYDRDLRIREGEADDGIYSINEPLPDISEFIEEDEEQLPDPSPGQTYIRDGSGHILTGAGGRRLTPRMPVPSGALGGAAQDEYATNGPTNANASFVGSPFAMGSESASQAGDIASLRGEMLSRLDDLEVVIRQSTSVAPNRGHNNPPELLDVERPITQEQFREVIASIAAIRNESQNTVPNLESVVAEASTFRRIANALGIGALAVGAFVVQEVASLEIGVAHTQYRHEVITALTKAYDSVMVWAQSVANLL